MLHSWNNTGHTVWDSAAASGASVDRKYHLFFLHFVVKKDGRPNDFYSYSCRALLRGHQSIGQFLSRAEIDTLTSSGVSAAPIYLQRREHSCNDSRLKHWQGELLEVPLMLSLQTLLTLGKKQVCSALALICRLTPCQESTPVSAAALKESIGA